MPVMGAPQRLMERTTPKLDKAVIDKLNGIKVQEEKTKDRYKKELGKDEFLRMLTFQLQNQDPMKPMEQLQMTSELAQLSQLEEMSQIKKMMERQGQNSIAETKFYGAGLLGKKVFGRGDLIHFGGEGKNSTLRFKLGEDSDSVIVRLLDKKGNIVYQNQLEQEAKGVKEVVWKGESMDGSVAPKGSYQLEVLAFDALKAPLPVETQTVGIVDGVEYDQDNVFLLVGGQKFDLRNVDRIEAEKDVQIQEILNKHKNNIADNEKLPDNLPIRPSNDTNRD